jgi:hypothetical protein
MWMNTTVAHSPAAGRRVAIVGIELLACVPFVQGLRELAEWLAGKTAEDDVWDAGRGLEARGLTMEGAS